MADITNKQDLTHLVDSFYQKVRQDPHLGPVFSSKVPADKWPQHLARMTSFWNTVLFGEMDYKGNPFSHHRSLPIDKVHFDHWIKLFVQSVQDDFSGPKADEAMFRAHKMRQMFETKLDHIRANPGRYTLV